MNSCEVNWNITEVKVDGILGNFTADKFVSVDRFESVDNLIDMIVKFLRKYRNHIDITFGYFGNTSVSYGRMIGNFANGDDGKPTYDLIEWRGNSVDRTENVKLTRKNVKENILHFIERFKEDEENVNG